MKCQRGIALITVLSVLAVVAMLSTAGLLWQQTALQRTTFLLQSSQALDYLTAMETWAEAVLLRDAKTSSIDSLQESWALTLAPIAVERGMISGELEDLQGRFNLNNLVVDKKFQPEELARFQRLLGLVGVEGTQAEQIAQALRDWLDPDQTEEPSGAEDYYYLALSPAYRTGDGPLFSPTELLLVKGMTSEIWENLKPYVAALPGYQPVNVNTAAKTVLQSLSEDMTEPLVEDILDHRLSTPFASVTAFLDFRKRQHDAEAKLPKLAVKSLSVTSQYFLLRGEAMIAEQALQARLLIHRKKQQAAVIQRSFGQYL